MSTLIPFLLGLVVTAGLLVPLILRLRGAAAHASQRADGLDDQLRKLRESQAKLEQDQQSLTQFLKEFPHLARDLFAGLTERQIPHTVLHAVQRSLEPANTIVLVKRTHANDSPPHLVVAAVAPEGSIYRPGTEVPFDTGEIGFAAETQLVMSRQDLSSLTNKGRMRSGPDPLPGLQSDFIAPLAFDQETLGLILVSRPKKTAGDPKAALRLIGQVGAQALHAAASYTRMRASAEMDALTQCYNKRHMEQALNDLLYRTACASYDRHSRGEAEPAAGVSILLFDIDHFKHYNDTNGHLAGDKLLQELAGAVHESVRNDDIFGRFGGEEFLLILPNTNITQALAAANKLRTLIAARPFASADRQPLGALSVSGGVAEYPHDGTDAASLLHAADTALYEAKRSGRNRMVAATRGASGAPSPGTENPPAPATAGGTPTA